MLHFLFVKTRKKAKDAGSAQWNPYSIFSYLDLDDQKQIGG